ncbi:hypothetical protein AWZ03_008655 [Drosophila navojoa]|uniref:Uncharacterized protein n=1 Tax=Drosophila navojoa TaxID=7232 RepID=A0A484B8F2_DRONA|nr:hypothetical protein AWZ03_008655 [Drosophila navojoa]
MQYSDEKKIVPKEPDDKPDPELEKCLNPGYKLIAELSDIICSGSSDDFAVSRSLPDSYFIFMTAFLALFYKGAPMTI